MIYEYKCNCNHITEKSMKITDEHPKFVKCEKCGEKAYRHFAVSAVIPPHMRAGDEGFNYEKNTQIHGKKYY